ncbi:g8011 [Coccomyxa viridis]|uniref:G8011 protein n=1 Tax=Coccomyxa viridis TaxID=1274662 RepID=A0ABP1G460_9CHLO
MDTMEEELLAAIKRRQDEFKANLETMTLKKCRKVLEEDMGLGPGGLDSHKDHVRDLIEKMVVNPQPEPKAASQASKRPAKAQAKKETDRKQKKVKEPEAKQPAAKESGSKVQKLKRVCKAATIAIPPSVYTRVTSEEDVIQRLEDLLSKHGLAKDSSAEEVARVKRNLKKERDLDGMDTKNILESSRSRRSRPVHSAYVASHSDDDEDVTGDENKEPGNGKRDPEESKKEPTPDKEVEARKADDKRHAVQPDADVASPAARKSTHKQAPAPGKAPKRLADWSESDEEY